MKYIKKIIYAIILSVVVISGQFCTDREINNKIPTKTTSKSLSADESKAALKKWEASPDGIMYKKWENSPEGKKVHASYIKIKKYLNAFANMEAVVTSVTFQRKNAKSSSPKWLIVKIEGEEYMMQFSPKDFESLKNLKVNDKIIVKSRSAGLSHNHPYLIISSDYISQNNKILFKRDFNKNNRC